MLRIFLDKKVYYAGGIIAALFMFSFFVPALYAIALVLLAILIIALLADVAMLYAMKKGITANRQVAPRLSMNDDNKVALHMDNRYNFTARIKVIDEMPDQFQYREWQRSVSIKPGEKAVINYFLKPLTRGEYVFNNINILVQGPLRLAMRYYKIPAGVTVKVYPSYMQMRRYQLLAIGNKLNEAGVKKIRRLGHSTEFEQIKDYVRGDDYRTINWKATGRRGALMVNNYTDEKSQQVYCIINKGRIMKMPFDGMALMDYAINATLVLANVAITKQDKAGLVTFAQKVDTVLPADKKPGQMSLIQEALYRQHTDFLEADYERLYAAVRQRISARSLLLLFTNFESLKGLEREMPALKKLAHYHLLVVVFFENTAIKTLTENKAQNLEEVYIKTIAEKFAYEKRQMVKELQQQGIISILTTPEGLTVNTINKYLELKNRAWI